MKFDRSNKFDLCYNGQADMGTILILKSKSWFDFKSSEISMILILKRIQNQNHFMTFYCN